jgi:hypothetical protein
MSDYYDWGATGETLGKKAVGVMGGFEEGQSRMAKELAANSMHMAQAGLAKAKAERLKSAPQYTTKIAAQLAGLNQPQADEVEHYDQTGRWGGANRILALKPAEAPGFATPQAIERYKLAKAAHLTNLGATGDTNAEQVVAAYAKLLGEGRTDAALSGAYSLPQVQNLNGFEAAKKGALYNFHDFGTGNQATGSVDFNQPYLDKTGSEVRENNAQAGNAMASAALSRSKIGQPQFVVGPDGSPVAIQPQNLGKPPAGYRWKQDGSLEPIPGGPVDTKLNPPQRIQDAKDVLTLLDMAGPILDQATGSFGGTGVDMAARVIGKSTDGGEAAAQLKALEGALVSKMPKMSGPQSDKDVLLYRQMAGQIGDSTIPAEQKRAAMAAIRTLNERYASPQPAARTDQHPQTRLSPGEVQASVLKARKAVADGKDKAEVIRRLEAAGITNHGIN